MQANPGREAPTALGPRSSAIAELYAGSWVHSRRELLPIPSVVHACLRHKHTLPDNLPETTMASAPKFTVLVKTGITGTLTGRQDPCVYATFGIARFLRNFQAPEFFRSSRITLPFHSRPSIRDVPFPVPTTTCSRVAAGHEVRAAPR